MLIFTKMKTEIFQKIEIPEEVQVEIKEGVLTVKGPSGENQRKFDDYNLEFKKQGDLLIIGNKKSTKKEKKRINSISSHIRNMIKGVIEKFEYKVKICSSHFPMSVSIDNKKVIIKNFLGEKIPRKVDLPEGAEIEIKGDIITIKSVDKELAGQAAANLESATKITNRDRRIFQDGLYIISKNRREI